MVYAGEDRGNPLRAVHRANMVCAKLWRNACAGDEEGARARSPKAFLCMARAARLRCGHPDECGSPGECFVQMSPMSGLHGINQPDVTVDHADFDGWKCFEDRQEARQFTPVELSGL